MRKLIVALVAVLYFGVSSGMVITVHQCMGKIASVSFNAKEKPCKCSAKAKKKMPCCKSSSQLAKVNGEHQPVQAAFEAMTAIAYFSPVYSVFEVQTIQQSSHTLVKAHSPPLPSKDIYLQNRVFRI